MYTLENMEKYKNKVLNIDCLEFMKQVPDDYFDLVLTDPPYGMSYERHIKEKKHRKIKNDCNLDWLANFIYELERISSENSHIYMFASWHNIDVFKAEFQNNFHLKNILVWDKGGMGMGDLKTDFGGTYELILFGTKLSKTKKQRALNGNRDKNILNSFRSRNEFHPTQKPEKLIEFLLGKSKKENDKVFDPFMGSGTTGLACKSLGLDFWGCELDEDYCKIANKRLEQVQGSLF